jgi:hypothetical protein
LVCFCGTGNWTLSCIHSPFVFWDRVSLIIPKLACNSLFFTLGGRGRTRVWTQNL